MKNRDAAAHPLKNPEVVINLWAYSGEDGTILRLAGKTYVMQGTNAEKLALLRQLAASDFLSAPWHKVPANFTIQHTDFGEMKGRHRHIDDQQPALPRTPVRPADRKTGAISSPTGLQRKW